MASFGKNLAELRDVQQTLEHSMNGLQALSSLLVGRLGHHTPKHLTCEARRDSDLTDVTLLAADSRSFKAKLTEEMLDMLLSCS